MFPNTRSSLAVRLEGELPPTPPLPSLVQTLACRWAPLGFFERCRAAYGDRFTLYPLDMTPVVMLSSPRDVREMLAAPAWALHPGAGGQALAPIVGDSSFMLREQEEHMRGRRAVLPHFGRAASEAHAEMVGELAAQEVSTWPLDTPLALHPRLRALALRVILRAVFGEECAELAQLHARMLAMLDVTVSFVLVEPRLRYLPSWRATWRRFVSERAAVDDLIATLIGRGERAAAAERGGLLGALLEACDADGAALSRREIRDSLVSVILAGHETTASQLAWALLLIAHNPRVGARLGEELDGGAGEEYLTATIAEVLRHRPVFLFTIPRVVVEPIEIGGWLYRPPAQLLGCVYLLQHDRAHYEEPQAFRPERFLDGAPDPRTWLPWGGGRKRCPGHSLATLELRAVLRAVLADRTLHPVGGRLERARWRSVIVTPGRGARVLLAARAHRGSGPSLRT